MKTLPLLLTGLSLWLAAPAAVVAAGYPWKNHAAPYDFVFGNDIDTHLQTRVKADGSLFGFFYVRFTGETTADGYAVAAHVDCNSAPGCTVGWIVRGKAARASYLYRVSGDHPVWQVRRADIPQPGAYAHFHFLGAFPTATNERRDGFFLELQAVDSFCFTLHGVPVDAGLSCADNGGVPVAPGVDIATHLNIVTSFPDTGGL